MTKGAQTLALFSDGSVWLRGRSSQTAAICPAILLGFDNVEAAGANLMQLPLIERRQRLVDVLDDLHLCLQLILQTSDPRSQLAAWTRWSTPPLHPVNP